MKIDVTRAWKDEAYLESLTAEERAALPANPAGVVELDEAQLDGVAGGTNPPTNQPMLCTYGQYCYTNYTCDTGDPNC